MMMEVEEEGAWSEIEDLEVTINTVGTIIAGVARGIEGEVKAGDGKVGMDVEDVIKTISINCWLVNLTRGLMMTTRLAISS